MKSLTGIDSLKSTLAPKTIDLEVSFFVFVVIFFFLLIFVFVFDFFSFYVA